MFNRNLNAEVMQWHSCRALLFGVPGIVLKGSSTV